MNTQPFKLASLVLLPASVLLLSSCSSTRESQSDGLLAYQAGEPGGIRIATRLETATVSGINRDTREVTLLSPDGHKEVVTAGPEVANFAQLEVGDRVKAMVTEQLVVFVRKPGETPEVQAAALVALAPLGAKPGAVLARTIEIKARVRTIDVKGRKATLAFPDGRTKSFDVRSDIDLTKYYVGDEVVIRATEARAIAVTKP